MGECMTKFVSLRWWLSAGGVGRLTGTDVFEVPVEEEVNESLGMRILDHLSYNNNVTWSETKFEIATLSGYATINFGVLNIREIKSTKRRICRLSIFRLKEVE